MSSSNFQKTYENIVEYVSKKVDDVLFEDPSTIEQCCIEVSSSDLEKLSDREFAKSIYFKILNRPPHERDITGIMSKLKSGKTTKPKEIKRLLNSEEYKQKEVKVKVVK